MRILPFVVLLSGCALADSPEAAAPPLRVMTFNIRYGAAPDGDNHWDKRKELCVSRAVAFTPDLVGLQEALEFQNDFFLSKLEGFGMLGVGRDDGKKKGEFSTVLYRKSRFEPAGSGTFWLSETPGAAGSRGWDAAFPRIATWGIFRDRQAGDRELLFVNTHFDHRGERARPESAKLLRSFLEKNAGGRPVIVTGDFNSFPASEAHRTLSAEGAAIAPLVDAFRALHPEPAEGTARPFGAKEAGPRIDWILCSPSFRVREAAIDRFHENVLYPSDHCPVTAVLDWPVR